MYVSVLFVSAVGLAGGGGGGGSRIASLTLRL